MLIPKDFYNIQWLFSYAYLQYLKSTLSLLNSQGDDDTIEGLKKTAQKMKKIVDYKMQQRFQKYLTRQYCG